MNNKGLETVIQICRDLVLSLEREGMTVEEMRAAFAEVLASFPAAGDTELTRVDADGVPVNWVVPPDVAHDRVLLYLHGGGYVVCTSGTHGGLIDRIARAAGVKALGVDYRLAPENPFPAAVEDAAVAYRWLVNKGIAPSSIIIAGDSAGGGLVLSTLVRLRDDGDQLPGAAVCLSPWVDLEALGDSMTANMGVDPLVKRETLLFMARLYLADCPPRTPLAAPLYADLRGLPRILIQVGSSETLLDDAKRIADKIEDAGGAVELEVWPDMVHCWQLFAPILPEGQQAISRIGEFIRSNIKRDVSG